MTHISTHTLTPLEKQCGVTLDQVAEELPRALIQGGRVTVSAGVGPALGGSVARCALGVDEVSFVGLNRLGMPIYEAAATGHP